MFGRPRSAVNACPADRMRCWERARSVSRHGSASSTGSFRPVRPKAYTAFRTAIGIRAGGRRAGGRDNARELEAQTIARAALPEGEGAPIVRETASGRTLSQDDLVDPASPWGGRISLHLGASGATLRARRSSKSRQLDPVAKEPAPCRANQRRGSGEGIPQDTCRHSKWAAGGRLIRLWADLPLVARDAATVD